MATENQKIEIRKRRAYSAVPDDILTDVRLGFTARIILAYALGRPTDWVLYVSQLRRVMGIGETAWKRARTEMEKVGYYQQVRGRDENGKIVWTNIVTDSPTLATIPSEPMDGKPIHGEPRDIAARTEHTDLNNRKSSSSDLARIFHTVAIAKAYSPLPPH